MAEDKIFYCVRGRGFNIIGIARAMKDGRGKTAEQMVKECRECSPVEDGSNWPCLLIRNRVKALLDARKI